MPSLGMPASSGKKTRLAHLTETYAALDNPQECLAHDFGFIAQSRSLLAIRSWPHLWRWLQAFSTSGDVRRLAAPGDLRESVEMHRKIYRAIRARNADTARAAMSEHLILAERALALEEAENKGRAGWKDSADSHTRSRGSNGSK